MRNCFDEGKLQAWSDGELTAGEAANVAAHLNVCAVCADAARTVKAENLVLAEGLAAEFAVAIPTDHLRQRIDRALAEIHPRAATTNQPRWRFALESFAFRPLAFAAIAIIVLLAGLFGLIYLKKQNPPAPVADRTASSFVPLANTTEHLPENQTPPTHSVSRDSGTPHRSKPRIRGDEPDAMSLAWQENQYQFAIAKLNEAIKIQPPMRPSLRVEYEYNMAVINDRIATSRDAARKNPKDPQAAQFMLTAYQSKVDLLNEVANTRVSEE